MSWPGVRAVCQWGAESEPGELLWAWGRGAVGRWALCEPTLLRSSEGREGGEGSRSEGARVGARRGRTGTAASASAVRILWQKDGELTAPPCGCASLHPSESFRVILGPQSPRESFQAQRSCRCQRRAPYSRPRKAGVNQMTNFLTLF